MNKMVSEEMTRIINEVFKDSEPSEQIIATVVIVAVANDVGRLSISTKRLVFEVLYKYYALLEGLKK